MIRVRVDDFPHTKGEPQHTLEAFLTFHRELSGFIGGKSYLLGVIPGRCRPDDLLALRRETNCVFGMHGTDHDEARLSRNGGNQFEQYLSAKQVRTVLQENRLALEAALGQRVVVYMPPRNVIDMRVSLAASDAGFEWFTTGPETDLWSRGSAFAIHSEPPYEYGRSDELLACEAHLRLMEKSDRGHDSVLTLHWTWETNIGLQHLRSFLSQIPHRYFEDFDA